MNVENNTHFEFDPKNESQFLYWDNAGGEHWVSKRQHYDAQLLPYNELIISGASIGAEDKVIDIGCGTGALAAAVTQYVNSEIVHGFDISRHMIDGANDRKKKLGLRNLEFTQADLQVANLNGMNADVAISRFGVMFFANPTRAFSNIAAALKRNGRLCFVCWQSKTQNEWVELPTRLVAPMLGEPPSAVDDNVPNPFSLAEPARITEVLTDAKFENITIDSIHLPLYVGGKGSPEELTDFVLTRAVVADMLRKTSVDVRERTHASVVAAIQERHDGVGVRETSAAWLVTARHR